MTQLTGEDAAQARRADDQLPDAGPSIVARVAAAVAERPEALAVSAPDATLTYAQLWRRALGLAQRLRSAGLRPGGPVVLCLPRSADLVVGALAILVAGGFYVALDPSQPRERLQFVVTDSRARLAVAGAGLAAECVLTPCAADDALSVSASAPEQAAGHDLAYIVYTSGSTGEPKGVLVEHASVLNLVDWHQNTFALTAADRTTQLASPGFDASIWEIWPCLTAGASLHVPAEDLKTDPGALRDWLVAERITASFLPTPLAEAVIGLDWPAAALRFLLTGGDVLHRRPPPGLPFTLVNNYGVAEATVVSTSAAVAPATGDSAQVDLPSMGAAIAGVQLTVVDEADQPVSTGTAGELVIGGVSVARGYLDRPELDRARFAETPSGGRAYRTGDLVRAGTDGELEYLGRIDDQVQLRGFRIELGEIETVLDQHPAVRASAVVLSGNGGAQFLSAYVVGVGENDPTPAELRAHLAAHLPEHMLPRDFAVLPQLPTTVNGKLDRAALRQRETPHPERAPGTVAGNDVERAIAAIVAERLALPQVGVDENFFLLGGHSMLGAQLIIRISEQFGVEMSLRALFEHPTVAEIAGEVERLLVEQIATMSEEELLAATAQLDGGIAT